MIRHAARRGGVLAVVSLGLVFSGSGLASAHVTAQPGSAVRGSYAAVAFRVPSERPAAGTVTLEVTLPAAHPIASARTAVLPGWTPYDDGTVVRWDQPVAPGDPEPDHPAPTLTLVGNTGQADPAATTGGPGAAVPTAAGAGETVDGTARWLGGLGLVVGALGLGIGVRAVLRGRRS